MAYSAADLEAAITAQTAAATCGSPQTRLIAGPGTGKSRTIEQRVGWLLSQGIEADNIAVISFTRASASDLAVRIQEYGSNHNIPSVSDVRVTTLHSLALRVLRRAGLLNQYPVDPIVLNDWETTEIFDAEFSESERILPSRCAEIRRYNEAYWQTGTYNPPNFIPPEPPVTPDEQQSFQAFHAARTLLYSCVLPGEIIRQCVEATRAGTLSPNTLVHLKHLIVDEFQDLNPLDQEFIDHFIGSGVCAFICGDDDQSIYSFRFAAPQGIQRFVRQYLYASDHALQHCFRYEPQILDAANAVMARFPVPNRVTKNFISMYSNATPPVTGEVFRWRYKSGTEEARSIASACSRLITAGIPPDEILILLSNNRALGGAIENALTAAGLRFEGVNSTTFRDTDVGRFMFTCLRIICERNDYIARRVLLGQLPRVGVGTCDTIANQSIANNLNYLSLFYDALPEGIFTGRSRTALDRARQLCEQLNPCGPDDSLAERSPLISALLLATFGQGYQQEWEAFAREFPQMMTLNELREVISASSNDQIAKLERDVFERLGLPEPERGFLYPRIRIMTMHGAKGLNAQVVFIPGLEDEVFPGNRRQPYPGLILEGARLLYVSITRARVACFLSYVRSRFINGQNQRHAPSRYMMHTGGAFHDYTTGLSVADANDIVTASQNL
jgi:DNA helicase-2/ATP-dependent DNA helicase PcrA